MLQDKGQVDGLSVTDGHPPPGLDRVSALEREVAQLREALEQRRVYGVVTGLLAARFGMTPERSWALLVRLSQHNNLKLRVVARIIHDSYFHRLAPEDRAQAARLNSQLLASLGSVAGGGPAV